MDDGVADLRARSGEARGGVDRTVRPCGPAALEMPLNPVRRWSHGAPAVSSQREKTMSNVARWVVCAVALSTGAAYADEAAAMAAKVKAELQKIDARLKLSPDQKEKMKGILEEKFDKQDALDKEYRAKLRDVMTPAQQTEWDKIKSEYKAKMKAAH
jgi:hypothetical protein